MAARNEKTKNPIASLEETIERLEAEVAEKRKAVERHRLAGIASAEQAEEAARAQARAVIDGDDDAVAVQVDVEQAAARAARNAREAARILEREVEALMARLTSERAALETARQAEQRQAVEAATGRFLSTITAAAADLEAATTPDERARIGEALGHVFAVMPVLGSGGRQWTASDLARISSSVAVANGQIATTPVGDWDGIEVGPIVAIGLLCHASITLPPSATAIAAIDAPAGHTLNVPALIADRLIQLNAATRLTARALPSDGASALGDQALGALSEQQLAAHRMNNHAWRRGINSRRSVVIGHPRTWQAADAAAAIAEPPRARAGW